MQVMVKPLLNRRLSLTVSELGNAFLYFANGQDTEIDGVFITPLNPLKDLLGGLSLNQAITRYAARNKNCFTEELLIAMKKVQLGKSFGEAMREMDDKL